MPPEAPSISAESTVGEVVTITLDLTKHDPNVTVVITIVTFAGLIEATIDPHKMH